jgi:hypothetical protein
MVDEALPIAHTDKTNAYNMKSQNSKSIAQLGFEIKVPESKKKKKSPFIKENREEY